MMAEVQVQPKSKYLQQNKVYKTVIWPAGLHGRENSSGAQFEKKVYTKYMSKWKYYECRLISFASTSIENEWGKDI